MSIITLFKGTQAEQTLPGSEACNPSLVRVGTEKNIEVLVEFYSSTPTRYSREVEIKRQNCSYTLGKVRTGKKEERS